MMIDYLFYFLLLATSIFTVITLYNLITAPRIKNILPATVGNKFISILIPARNEEMNIGKSLESILKQSYKNFEVLVLNDNSHDSTEEIVETYSAKDDRVKLIKGKPLPALWLGKNWACHQLWLKAKGELLLFMDADVRLGEHAISSSIRMMEQNNIQMLSSFPTQKINGIGAWLVVPLMNWLLLTFLPLKKVFSSPRKSLVAANGQYIIFVRKTYSDIGGHEAVKNKVVEDMELARSVKGKSLKMMTALGDDSIYCQMYFGFVNSFNGFSKNFYLGFNSNPAIFLLVLLFFEMVFFFPLLLLFNDYRFAIIFALLLIMRIIISITSKQSVVKNVLAHPLQIIIMYFVGINSLLVTISKKAVWKGRRI